MTFTHPVAAAGAAFLLGTLVTLGIATASAESIPSEPELLAVLRSEAADADKAIACKQLAIKGSKAAVGDLAKLLANDRLASWARIALEAIPGPEADAALRSTAGARSGRLAVGAINSLGVRRDAAATALLAGKLADPNAEVASAAAAALGTIGTADSAAALMKALTAGGSRLDTFAGAAVVCAERLVASGRVADGVKLFDTVRTAKVSEQRAAEATRGLILARGKEGIPLLVETLRSPSKRLANIGLFTARELLDGPKAGDVDMALADEVTRQAGTAGGERASLLIKVLADRNADGGAGAGLLAIVMRWAKEGSPLVRVAAIEATGRIGDASAVDPLLAMAADAAVSDTARGAIAALPGDGVDRAVLDRLSDGDPALLPILARVVGERRIPAVAQLSPLLSSSDAATRLAVVDALGNVVDLGNLGLLIDAVAKPRDAIEAEAAQKALLTACVRMHDREACADKLSTAIAAASGDAKVKLLDIVGEVGGTRALVAVAVAAKSSDPVLQDAATRLLGKWMTADAAPVLLELSKTLEAGKFQTRAIRGYIRIARQFALPDAERADMCRSALGTAKDSADQKAVLEILPRYPSVETLAVADEAAKIAGLEAEAKAAADAIRAKLSK